MGGEKARLLLGLAAFDGPHLLILDEPTNHLDIPIREALVEALAEYKAAVIIVSHDRAILDASCDRLLLVADGQVKTFDGDLDDYEALIVSGRSSKDDTPREAGKGASGTIDNDIYCTDYTIGFDTAINTAIEAVDKIRDTAGSHNRLFFVEVMGRHAGFIALHTGIGSGAGAIFLPETDTSIDELSDILRKSAKRSKVVQFGNSS